MAFCFKQAMKHTDVVRAERNMTLNKQRSFTSTDTVGMHLKYEICLYISISWALKAPHSTLTEIAGDSVSYSISLCVFVRLADV